MQSSVPGAVTVDNEINSPQDSLLVCESLTDTSCFYGGKHDGLSASETSG